jgi:hypothetical protein
MGEVKHFISLKQHCFTQKNMLIYCLVNKLEYGAISMKRIRLLACTAAALTLSSVASAAIMGPYLGVGIGQDQVKTPDKYAFNVSADPAGSTTRNRNGVGVRGFAGYNFTKYVGIETGYTKYARSIYVGRASGAYSSLTYYIHTYDLVGKGYIPLGDSGFNLYALAGFARVVETINYVNNGVPATGNILMPSKNSNHVWRNRPLAGLGVSYSFMKHFTANLEATHVQQFNSFSTTTGATPALDLYTLNLAYNFC